MAYQRRKRRFDRKKVVLVERTICILILLALLALAGRWIAGQLSKEDSQKKTYQCLAERFVLRTAPQLAVRPESREVYLR